MVTCNIAFHFYKCSVSDMNQALTQYFWQCISEQNDNLKITLHNMHKLFLSNIKI
jgi:hypothetical protein